jgi:hypothetical protein
MNGIWRQHYTVSNELQDVNMNVVLSSVTGSLTRCSLSQNTIFMKETANRAEKAQLPLQLRKNIPHNHIDLPPHVSIEATRVCMHTGCSPRPVEAIKDQIANATVSAPADYMTEMPTLSTEVQHIMTDLRAAETEDDRIHFVMQVVYSLVKSE